MKTRPEAALSLLFPSTTGGNQRAKERGVAPGRLLRTWQSAEAHERVYYPFPRPNRPRLFVDSFGWDWASELFQPQGMKRLGWRTFSRVAGLGLARCVLPRYAVSAAGLSSWLPPAWSHPDAVSILLGSEGPERKAVAQVVVGGQIVGYVKIADDEAGRWLVANERRVLTALEHSICRYAPRVVMHRRLGDVEYLGIEAVEGRAMEARLTDEHRALLRQLANGASGPLTRTEVADRIRAGGRFCPELEGWLRILDGMEGVDRMPLAVVHGDFAPWNLRAGSVGVRAVDWEYGVVRGVAGIDLVHFIVNTAALLGRRSSDEVVRELVLLVESSEFFAELAMDRAQRRAVVVAALLFDVATGVVATSGVLSPLNRMKLSMLEALGPKR